MGLQFIVKDGVPHYTTMKDKCDTIQNMQTPKLVKECQTFCGMVNFLSTFCKNLCKLLIPIYELTKKRARFQWTDKHQKAFEDIKKLLVKPPVLRMVSGDGIFRLESDTSRTAVGGMLYQWQDNQWVLVGYHSKKLPEPVQNYGVTELELTGLVANIHGFEQKLRHNYFEVIVDHKAIDYLTKSKHQPTTTRLANLLLKLADYTFDLKYLEGNKLKVSDALSHLYIEEKHKINDVIPLNFLVHYADRQLFLDYYNAKKEIGHYKHSLEIPKSRTQYARKAHNQQVERFQAGTANKLKPTGDKKQKPNTVLQSASVSFNPSSSQIGQLDTTGPIMLHNNAQPIMTSKEPLSLHEDQLKKQLVNTIREVPQQFFEDLKHVIPANDKLSVF